MSGGMAECNLIAQHSLTQQEFARQKSTKTRSSHMCHSTIQQSQGFSLERCPLAPVTTQNNCSTSSFAKGLGGYRGMKIYEGKKTLPTVGLCERKTLFLVCDLLCTNGKPHLLDAGLGSKSDGQFANIFIGKRSGIWSLQATNRDS